MLRDRPFRLLFASRTVSMLGNAIAPVALAFAVLSLPGATATTLGLVLLGRTAAQVVCLIVAGVVADRMPRYLVMMAAELLAGATQVVVAVLFVTHSAHVGTVVGLEVLNGAAVAFFLPASTGVVPEIVPLGQLQPANALLRMSINFSMIVGAAIAGVLVATVGPGWALMADACSFFLSAALLAGIRIASTARAERSTMIDDLRHGWRELSSRQWVWMIVVAASVINACFTGASNVLGPLVAKQHLGGAPAWALITGADSAGLLLGAFVAFRVRPTYPLRVATLACVAFSFPLFLLAGPAPLWFIAAGSFCLGISSDLFGVLWDTGLQALVPRDALSRVSAYDALGSFAVAPIGLAVAGPVADAIGIRETLIGGGALIVLSCLAALLSSQIRTLQYATQTGSDQQAAATPGEERS